MTLCQIFIQLEKRLAEKYKRDNRCTSSSGRSKGSSCEETPDYTEFVEEGWSDLIGDHRASV